jgi:prephenate dehydrogenase
MGGSLARELAHHGVKVLAYDMDATVVSAALAEGVVHTAVGEDLEGAEEAEIVVIATPVDAAIVNLGHFVDSLPAGAVVTDLGSTKRSICKRAAGLGIGDRFVGSHPLAGDHRSGWLASRLGLYAGIPVFLCPTPDTTAETMADVDHFWEMLGAFRHIIDPAEHDRRMAWVSHLPQVVSSALAAALSESGYGPADLGPGGREMIRLAGSSPEMWSAISLANADHLEQVVEEMKRQLDRYRSALQAGDGATLRGFFRSAGEWSS